MLDQVKLTKQAGEEIKRLDVARSCVQFTFGPATAMTLIGILQLALRHPQLPGSSLATALAMLPHLRQMFERYQCPACMEIIRQGEPCPLPTAGQDVVLDEAPQAARKEAL